MHAATHARPATADPPRILVAVDDPRQRTALVAALRDTGYDVLEAPPGHPARDAAPSRRAFDLVLADMTAAREGEVPTLLVSDPCDVVSIEMLVLDLLGWDGPPTLRRIPAALRS